MLNSTQWLLLTLNMSIVQCAGFDTSRVWNSCSMKKNVQPSGSLCPASEEILQTWVVHLHHKRGNTVNLVKDSGTLLGTSWQTLSFWMPWQWLLCPRKEGWEKEYEQPRSASDGYYWVSKWGGPLVMSSLQLKKLV